MNHGASMLADRCDRLPTRARYRYCSNNNFFVLQQLDARIKDAEQRIADDIHGLFHWALSDVIIGGIRKNSMHFHANICGNYPWFLPFQS